MNAYIRQKTFEDLVYTKNKGIILPDLNSEGLHMFAYLKLHY